MASTIKIKRSSVAGKSPTTSDISAGELALNIKDQKLYSSNGSAVFEIGGGGGGGGSAANGFSGILVGANVVVADSSTDRLTITAGTRINIAANPTTDTITFSASTNDYLQVANASSIYQTKAVERAALANTNAYIATKLNSSSYTASDVLSKLITVDGAGSGLDADTLDGQSSAYFAVAATENSRLANTNAYIATKLNSSSYTEADVRSKAALANTNAYIATKLNSSSYTASDVLSKLITVDGSGSGLDADLLDGLDSGQFMRDDASATNTVDLRAPIFYDSNNTAYYTDPASTSVLNTVTYALLTGPATNTRDKIRLWSGVPYSIGMTNAFTFGPLGNDYAMTFQMNNSSTRGFWWGHQVHTTAQGTMALSTDGKLTVAHSIRLGYGESDTTVPGATYRLDVSGIGYASTDFRAPIFYDSDNTSYYTNPASTSVLNTLLLYGTVYMRGAESSQTLTDGASIAWDTDSGRIAYVTIAGNRTIAAPTNAEAGSYVLHVIQDATGSRTLTWNSVFKWPGGVAPVLSTGAGKRDIFFFTHDGTNFYGSYVNDVR